jgi:hypothetical protein
VAHITIGVPVRRQVVGGLLALMLGSVDLMLLLYGLALGIYTLWVLLTEEGKRTFQIAD